MIANLLEQWGDRYVLMAGGALIGVLFGFFAQRTRYCARATVMELSDAHIGERSCIWFLGFAAALLGTQLLMAGGFLQADQTRYLNQMGSVSGAIMGGLLFGAGMILTRGCASRLLILSANGNLRALLSGLVFAATVQASIAGLLLPARQTIQSWWQTDGGAHRQVFSALGLPLGSGVALSALLLILALALFWKRGPKQTSQAAGAIAVGLTIAAGWGFTQWVASASFEPVVVQSLTFSGPSADWLMRTISTAQAPGWGFDAGLIPAVFAGSLLAALIFREFKFEGFKTENRMGHYLVGAMLMGFGAVLAGGCTIGAGITGGALFATLSLLTLISIGVGASLTYRLHQRLGLST